MLDVFQELLIFGIWIHHNSFEVSAHIKRMFSASRELVDMHSAAVLMVLLRNGIYRIYPGNPKLTEVAGSNVLINGKHILELP